MQTTSPSSNVNSGLAANNFARSASEIVREYMNVQQVTAASAAHVQVNTEYTAVQESYDNEGDIDLNRSTRFHYAGERIVPQCNGDVDIQNAKATLGEFVQLLVAMTKCWTCFSRRRGVMNFPCGCLCSCQDCAAVMRVCSICYNRIAFTTPVTFPHDEGVTRGAA